MRSDELFTEIKFVIENFGEALTALFEVYFHQEISNIAVMLRGEVHLFLL